MGNDSSQPLKYGERLDNDITVNWKKIQSENPFPPREAHCSCAVGNKLYVFGGVVQTADDDAVESNELLIYDVGEVGSNLLDRSWTAIRLQQDVGVLQRVSGGTS